MDLVEFAAMVGTSYQNLQHLEDPEQKIKRPRYLPELAAAMGSTVEDLVALRMPPPLKRPETGLSGDLDEEQPAHRLRGSRVAVLFDKLPLTEQTRFLKVLWLMKDGFPTLGNLIAGDAEWLSLNLDSPQSGAVPDQAAGGRATSKRLT